MKEHVLDNGLRLVHAYDAATAMVAVDVLYNTGHRDERCGLTGIAHLFEHLMFGGSRNVPSFDGTLEAAGGKSNAWTSADFTNFYETLPARNLDTALFLESDRMLAPDLSEHSLEVQKSVVVEEFKQQCLDRPYGDLMHHLRRLAYGQSHSYSWPTIGLEPEHIARVTQADAREWFYSHYAPNNAVLAIVGHVGFDEACAAAERWFGDVPRRDIAPRVSVDPGFPTSDIVETVEGPVPYPLIMVAYPMDSYGTEGYYAADTITDLLSAGRSARFRTDLVERRACGLISEADASIIGSELPGLLLLTARVADNDTSAIERARKLLIEEARRLAEPGEVSAQELERSFNNFEANHRFSNIGYLPHALTLATAAMHGESPEAPVEAHRALTPSIITSTAERIFGSPSVSVIYRPKL